MTSFDSVEFKHALGKQIRSWWLRIALFGVMNAGLIACIIVFRAWIGPTVSQVLVILLSTVFLLFADVITRSDIRTCRRVLAWSEKLDGILEQHITCTVVSIEERPMTLDGVSFIEIGCVSHEQDMTLYMPELVEPVGFKRGHRVTFRVKNRRIVGLLP